MDRPALVAGATACGTTSEPANTPGQIRPASNFTPIPVRTNTSLVVPSDLDPAALNTPEPTATSSPTTTPSPPTQTPEPLPRLSQDGIRSILIAHLLVEVLSIQVPFPQIQVGAIIESWDVTSLYRGAGVWEVSGPGLRRSPESDSGIAWLVGRWWVTEDSQMALPANPPAVYLAEYLRGWTLVRPTPTPVPTTTPTPVPTPGPICDVQSEVIIEQVLGKMLDPLRLRADIDVRLRNTCTIPVTFLVEGVVLSLNADVRGRDTHFLPTMLLPGEMVTLSLVVLGNYWIGGELEYRVEIMDVPGAA